jgi:hypothetical protein
MKFLIVYILLVMSIDSLAQEVSEVKNTTPPVPVITSGTIKVAANPELAGNKWKKILIGKNYRREWTQPVTVPVINFGAMGLIPKKEGGGKQTRSLQVEDAADHKYKLRSIKKNPEKVVPEDLHNTIIEQLFLDGISASYPYGALSTGILSNAVGVPYLNEKLVYVGDDPKLGEFRSKYKNMLVYLEDEVPGNIPYKLLERNHYKSISTNELVVNLQGNHSNRVEQLQVLRARLLDNFLMDFDRHEGQWEWAQGDSAGHHVYYAVPKDRDQVFFKGTGLIMRAIAKRGRVPEFHGLTVNVKDIDAYNNAARNFDRTFLTSTTRNDWKREIDHLLNSMTDKVIDSALGQQPKEIQNYSAPWIATTLKQKRQYFKDYMLRYYDALAKTVSIVGSNEREEFLINENNDGSTTVTMYGLDSLGNHSTGVLYQRIFNPSETKEIRIYGLEGDDQFKVSGHSRIKIRMIGGPGKDQFINNGNASHAYAYDLKVEDNEVAKGIKNKLSNNPLVNEYNRLGWKYDQSSIQPAVELSASQGLFLGAAVKITKQGFRKEPYSSRQLFSVTHSVSSSSFHIKYNADFIKAIGNSDLLIRSDLYLPTLKTNYFGTGNETPMDKALFTAGYYHARYSLVNAALLGHTHLGRFSSISYGPSFQYLQLKDVENRMHYVHSYLPPASHSNEYHDNYFAGAEASYNLDSRNDNWLPTLGVVFNAYGRVLNGINASAPNVAFAGGNFKFYKDLSSTGATVLAFDIGGGYTFGNYLFEQSQFLGYKDNLRGFRLQRFAGRSAAYNNIELRLRLANLKTFLAPVTVGALAFNDIGRVWADNENSNKWHNGGGVGLWAAPLNKIVFTGFVVFSKEERALPFVTIGYSL